MKVNWTPVFTVLAGAVATAIGAWLNHKFGRTAAKQAREDARRDALFGLLAPLRVFLQEIEPEGMALFVGPQTDAHVKELGARWQPIREALAMAVLSHPRREDPSARRRAGEGSAGIDRVVVHVRRRRSR